MNKLKEKIADLKNHLDRDERGMRLLEQVTRVANQFRTDLAEAKDRELAARQQADLILKQLQDANEEIRSLRQSVEIERSQRQQRERDVSAMKESEQRLKSQLRELEPEDFPVPERTERVVGFLPAEEEIPSLVDDLRPITEVFNQLRKQMRVVPRPVARKHSFNAGHEITDIICDLSNDELLKLGRFVACTALINFPCCIQAEKTMVDRHDHKKLGEERLGPFVKWMRKTIEINYSEPEPIPYGESGYVPAYKALGNPKTRSLLSQ